MSEHDDADRRAILERRARFVAAALAGVGIASCDRACDTGPMVCLEPQVVPSASATPCLAPVVEPAPDAARPPTIAPRVCLMMPRRPDDR